MGEGMGDIQIWLLGAAAMMSGGAAASGWTAAVIVANMAFDGLDAQRADRHLRRVLVGAAGFQAVLAFAAGGAALLGGAFGAAITAAIAGLGFLSNMWTLAPRKGKLPPGARRNEKARRGLAVSLTLMVTIAVLAAGILAILGI
jgi:hypothetical protein